MHIPRLCWLLILVFPVIGLGGCTINYKINTEASVAYPTASRHDLNVELRFTNEFINYEWTMRRMGDKHVMVLGEALANNAEAMSRALFNQVTVIRESENPDRFESSSTVHADAVLTPTVTVVERPMGTWAFDKTTTTIGVEWEVTDRAGALVWLHTFQGVGEANTGNAFTFKANARKQVDGAINDLFMQSFDAMRAAPELRALRARSP